MKVAPAQDFQEAIEKASQCLKSGGLVVYPTESFYGLGADATNQGAIERLFAVKKRPPDRPVLILIASTAMLTQYVDSLPPVAHQLMHAFWPGGLTLVFEAGPMIPSLLTANTGKIGVRLSSNPVATALTKALGTPVTGTSANISGEPACRSGKEVLSSLGEGVDIILDGGMTPGGMGSTILDVTADPPHILREGMVSGKRLKTCMQGPH
ncbi:MAG: threonylcarbamoyl-AMP synthase [Deltaproteobacteria bacterium]|nr:threonylcarbamoyl-AMP synthase [Deltaproteobacteria bacterium]